MFSHKTTIAPGIVVYKNAFTNLEELNKTIENDFCENFNPAKIVSLKHSDGIVSETHRKVKDFLMTDESVKSLSNKKQEFYKTTKESIMNCLDDYIASFSLLNSTLVDSGWILLKYDKEDFFKNHVDNGVMFPRIVSVTGYFNDNYSGGSIIYNNFNIKYKPEKGDVVIFPSDYVYSHEVEKITDGVRYAIVNWFRWKEWPFQTSIDK